MGAARTLLKLSRGYSEDFRKNDLSKATAALARCRAVESGDGSADADEETADLVGVLAEIVEGAAPTEADAKKAAAHPSSADAVPSSSSKDGRGEVVLKVTDDLSNCKGTILDKVVKVPGVVSVCFEGPLCIVGTRTEKESADPAFVEDLLSCMSEQGLEGITAVKRPKSTSDTNASSSHAGAPAPIPEDDEEQDSGINFMDDEGGLEPAYLDDDEDGTAGQGGGMPQGASTSGMGAGGPHWSFFSQSNWMTGRKMAEFDDDPTIAARLAKAKQRQEEKRKEEESRIGVVSRWLGWRRT